MSLHLDNNSGSIHCIILAAGQSSRFGRAKMLATLSNGEPMLRATVMTYLSVSNTVSVVLGPHAAELRQSLHDLNITIIDSPDFQQGMSASIVAGVSATPDSRGWLIGLGDMPYVHTETLQAILANFRVGHIVQPSFNRKTGNPVLFSNFFYSQLMRLSGDRGAKSIVLNNPEVVLEVSTKDSGVLHDIDFPDQILRT